MKWSPQQDEALRRVADWLRRGDQQVFRLFGYAGTGKTTLAKHFAQDVSDVHFCAFTGKAAKVLREKDCPGSTTIHKLIYKPSGKSDAAYRALVSEAEKLEAMLPDLGAADRLLRVKAQIRIEEDNLRRPGFRLNHDSVAMGADLIVVDECSMVDERMGRDLEYFGKPILVLGDPAQLPPVGGGGHFTECEPDFTLTEIHRQAADNPIIELSRRIREGERLAVGQYGESRVHERGTDLSVVALEADQMIAGRNKTRHGCNRRVRQLLQKEGDLPEEGDRLVCLKNNHNLGILNGAIYIAAEDAVVDEEDTRGYDLAAYPEDDEAAAGSYNCWRGALGGDLDVQYYEIKEKEHFDYGYCLTCHKSQGSQWDHVLVMDESAVFRADAKRWLYTAVTRASHKLDLISM